MTLTLSLALLLGTFASEDLTCIAAGMLIEHGMIGVLPGVLACAFGIFLGDVGLWVAGRVWGAAVFRRPWVARHLDGPRFHDMCKWLDRHAAQAIVGSRFIPGTRLPLYVTAGVMRVSGLTFATWALVGAMLWTPMLVLLTSGFGGHIGARLSQGGWFGAAAPLVTLAFVLALLRVVRGLGSRPFRMRVSARFARWSRWEFWPMWLFYLPVGVWVVFLAVRHRGLALITAANPGMPDGGTVGESKVDILKQLPAQWTIPFVAVEEGALTDRVRRLAEHAKEANWRFPLVLKPDVGQRGVGVRLARTVEDVETYLSSQTGRVLAQPYHEGPFEAGVFYYRMPGWSRGRILSITDKHFPVIVGDGRLTIEELIWAHPRYRMQADTFLRRHRDVLTRVLTSDERMQLAIAGNHAQGTLFRDGRHLLTPALERRIDEIAQAYPGFFVGRFDIRYRDVDEFKAGKDIAIVELNGATAESTNIYDPEGSLRDAYRQLFQQWSIVFAIGAANRRRGAPMSSTPRLIALMRAHLTHPVAFALSD